MLQAHSACPFFLGIGCSLIAQRTMPNNFPLKATRQAYKSGSTPKP